MPYGLGRVFEHGAVVFRQGIQLTLNFQHYMSIKQAADYLGVTPNMLRNWGRDGKIGERRNPLNNYRLYKRTDLDRLLRKVEHGRSAR